MSKKKLIVVALLVALAVLIVPAPPALEASSEVRIKTQVRVASWDIWLHADGKTWQETGAPGDRRSYTFDVAAPEVRGYTNLRHEMVVGVTEEQFMAAGGRAGYPPDEAGWTKFGEKILQRIPDNYRLIGKNQVGFTLSPLSHAERIKKKWQAEEVEGWRFYLPAFVTWYGVREQAAAPTRGGFYDVEALWGLRQGETVTYYYRHERTGVAGPVRFRIYNFSGEIGSLDGWHHKPRGEGLYREKTVNFAGGYDNWSLPLRIRVPDWGQELGHFITTSDTNFSSGVVINAAAAHERDYISRGLQHTNWHAGRTAGGGYVGYFKPAGRGYELGSAARVLEKIAHWETIRLALPGF